MELISNFFHDELVKAIMTYVDFLCMVVCFIGLYVLDRQRRKAQNALAKVGYQYANVLSRLESELRPRGLTLVKVNQSGRRSPIFPTTAGYSLLNVEDAITIQSRASVYGKQSDEEAERELNNALQAWERETNERSN